MACKNPVENFFSQIHSYLNHSRFDMTNLLVNGWLAVVTNTPHGFNMRFTCSHMGANGTTTSQAQAVVP